MRISALCRPLLALALLAATASRADTASVPPSGAQPSPHLAAAQRLYQKLDLDAAMAELREAEVSAKDNEDEMVQVLIYRGLIFSETGKTAEAQDMFKRALAIRPWVEVPPETSPRLAKAFGDARKSLWGNGAVKPPQRRRSQAVPATSTAPAPAAVPATATAPGATPALSAPEAAAPSQPK